MATNGGGGDGCVHSVMICIKILFLSIKLSHCPLTASFHCLPVCGLTADVELPVRAQLGLLGSERVAGGAPQPRTEVGHGGGELEDALGHVAVHRGALMTSFWTKTIRQKFNFQFIYKSSRLEWRSISLINKMKLLHKHWVSKFFCILKFRFFISSCRQKTVEILTEPHIVDPPGEMSRRPAAPAGADHLHGAAHHQAEALPVLDVHGGRGN